MNSSPLRKKENKKSFEIKKTVEKRKLTHFLVHEMLYSFLSNQLNPATHRAIEEYIKNSPETRKSIEDIQFALSYCKNLSKGKISPNLLNEVTKYKTFLRKFKDFFYWSKWPKWAQWSFEASSLAVIVATGFGITFFFLEQEKPNLKANKTLEKVNLKTSNSSKLPIVKKNLFPSENKKETQMIVKNQDQRIQTKEKSSETFSIEKPKKLVDTKNNDSLKSSPQIQASFLKNQAQNKNSPLQKSKPSQNKFQNPQFTKSNSPASQKTKASLLEGAVYKAFMRLENATTVTPHIVKTIKELRGQKAGRVKLGWIKKKGSYFHFSLPQENYDLLLKKLKTYGSVLVQKETHKRVMPKGEIRMILWIEKDLNNPSKRPN